MKNVITYSSTLPPDLFGKVNEYAEKLKIPKNKLIESALNLYFERLRKAEYVLSFRKAKNDPEISVMAEEGLDDFIKMLEE